MVSIGGGGVVVTSWGWVDAPEAPGGGRWRIWRLRREGHPLALIVADPAADLNAVLMASYALEAR